MTPKKKKLVPTARVLVWISVTGVSKDTLIEIHDWQMKNEVYPERRSTNPLQGTYSGAYSSKEAAKLLEWLTAGGVVVTQVDV